MIVPHTPRRLGPRLVNPVGLGCMNVCWAYGDAIDRDAAVALFRGALDAGYDHFDTANIYGQGRSEEILRDAVMDRRGEFYLATKTGIVATGPDRAIDCRPEAITASIDKSLVRLGTDFVDLVYMHRFDPTVPIADSVGAMARLVEAGKIGGYGVSEWSAAHIREAHAVFPMTAVQHEYSLWTRNVELGVLQTTAELGIAMVAFSPVGRGALCATLGDASGLMDKDLRRTMPRFTADHWPHNRALIERFEALALSAGVTAAQLALMWAMAQGEHVHVIPGTTSPAHMAENLGASAIDVPADVIAAAGELINHASVSGPRYNAATQAAIDTEEFA
ncbi:aldo/keto reductase [Novosphingobium colocasiae]|uniref:Aldo/keto reductase n=1 Tax=Novosphingobium colocasiae TaxID=1256513 RepID=A0A918PE57_9SPHN|nr:aldo/keto reductase [Novosphingobium colocasiae]GGZ03089.1 aldo/keto reductase [Novosphingobium colocasiae]